jgi:hypothetical protein
MGISADTSSMPLARQKYSLRSFPRLDKNPLWENCKAPVSEKFLRDFRCEGRSWADAQQGRQGEKIQKEPLSGGAGSTLVCYSQALEILIQAQQKAEEMYMSSED